MAFGLTVGLSVIFRPWVMGSFKSGFGRDRFVLTASGVIRQIVFAAGLASPAAAALEGRDVFFTCLCQRRQTDKTSREAEKPDFSMKMRMSLFSIKPSGLAVQGGTGLKENLDDSLMALSADGVAKPKLVHRLDRDTSGVLLIARTDYAAARLAASFRSHKTRKIYWAATCGVPRPEYGEIDAPLVKSGQIMRVAKPDDDRGEAKSAQTLYKVVEKAAGRMAFLALWPLTGRTHQLRVHLAHIGTPIWGDPLYGAQSEGGKQLPEEELGRGLHLHARRLIIPHPSRGLIDVTALCPP